MKFVSWPKPPIRKSTAPPKIPESFSLFGTQYKVENGIPKLDMPSKPLNPVLIKNSITKSFDLFLKLIETMDGNFLNDIRDVHISLNEEINLAKEYDGETVILEAKNFFNEEKTKIYNKIKEHLSNDFFEKS